MVIFDGALQNTGYPNRENVLLLPRGLPGSGKTTLLNNWQQEDPEHRVVIGRDDFRSIFTCIPVGKHHQENAITLLLTGGVEALLQQGWDVGVDSTHIQPGTIEHWINLAQRLDVKHEILDLTHIPIRECVRRDAIRKASGRRYVGSTVIRMMASRYLPEALR